MNTNIEATTPQEHPSAGETSASNNANSAPTDQLKLDFGEGPECHAAYEQFIKTTKLPDSTKLWLAFSRAWLLGGKP